MLQNEKEYDWPKLTCTYFQDFPTFIELIKYGHEKLALTSETSMSDVPNSPQRSGSSCSSHAALQRSTSLKNVTKVKKKVRFCFQISKIAPSSALTILEQLHNFY